MDKHFDETEQKDIYTEFKELINMSASEIEKWLKTDESKKVGWDSGDGESVGHKSGERSSVFYTKRKMNLLMPITSTCKKLWVILSGILHKSQMVM
jgi:hypothetical protein